jgi:hypothetical protein
MYSLERAGSFTDRTRPQSNFITQGLGLEMFL